MPKPTKPIEAGARVQWPKVVIDKRDLYIAALKHYDGMRVTLIVKPEEERRRTRANNYYYGVVLKMLAEETGHTADDLHEMMRLRHNSKLVADVETGEEVRIGQPTHTLSISDFSVYLERVMLWAAEHLGMTFPPPRKSEAYQTEHAA